MSARYHYLLMLLCIVALTSCCEQENGTGAGSGKFSPSNITIKELSNTELVKLGVDEHDTFMKLENESLIFIDSHDVKWIAPKETYTDGASIPQVGLSLTDDRFSREFLKAAVIHDAYCQKENKDQTPEQYRSKPWKVTHRMFHEAMLAGGTPAQKANVMFTFVYVFGPRWGDPDRDLEKVSNEMLSVVFNASKKRIMSINPTREEIETWVDKREPALIKISQLEIRSLSALRKRDLAGADIALRQAEEYLKSALEQLPNDSVLLNLRGIIYKNRANEFRQLDMSDNAKQYLDKAEQTFQGILSIDPKNTSALNGLSEVWELHNNQARAEEFYGKALAIDPGHLSSKRNWDKAKRKTK